jgi:hypothetical protein
VRGTREPRKTKTRRLRPLLNRRSRRTSQHQGRRSIPSQLRSRHQRLPRYTCHEKERPSAVCKPLVRAPSTSTPQRGQATPTTSNTFASAPHPADRARAMSGKCTIANTARRPTGPTTCTSSVAPDTHDVSDSAKTAEPDYPSHGLCSAPYDKGGVSGHAQHPCDPGRCGL